MRERVLFVAGATGAVGSTVVKAADARGIRIVPHVRPKHAATGPVDKRAALFELADESALVEALSRCTTVLQLIGTMRKRFSTGDTYETSDIGTTEQLVRAAKRAGIDHFVLLSAVGAGKPSGAYLKAKARAEAIVRESGIDYTIFRPSMLVGSGRGFAGADVVGRLLLRRSRFAPIKVDELAAALLQAATDRAPLGEVLEGSSLFDLVERARGGVGRS
jgi:uncharacterized protein YbjT (DUF2867 family)